MRMEQLVPRASERPKVLRFGPAIGSVSSVRGHDGVGSFLVPLPGTGDPIDIEMVEIVAVRGVAPALLDPWYSRKTFLRDLRRNTR
jgi:hypothetical protein